MKERQAALVRASWDRTAHARDELAALFYRRLFELDPRIEDLFAITEMGPQRGKFVTMMNEIVRLVQDPESFDSILRASGARHRGYGVVARDYRTVGEAFLWALDEVTPDGLDAESRAAWAEAYTQMAHVMQSGAAAPEADRSSG